MDVCAHNPASSYRGRIAPSPTGFLHLGHARTFWTAWQRAQQAGGTLLFRMEDLDPDRSRSHYAQAALEDLHGLGIEWSEGPDCGGPCAPYTQSERRTLYREAWHALLHAGHIYPCKCSRKDLAAAVAAPHEADPLDDEPIYPGTCRNTAFHAENPDGLHWRFRVPDGESIEFTDVNLGPQRYVAGRDFGDFVVWRRDGAPSYQLACVVDDAAMRITEVVRGADLLKSTARQILLQRALGVESPAWFHCALMVDANGKRLAKRHDALSLRTLRERGCTPEQILAEEFSI